MSLEGQLVVSVADENPLITDVAIHSRVPVRCLKRRKPRTTK